DEHGPDGDGAAAAAPASALECGAGRGNPGGGRRGHLLPPRSAAGRAGVVRSRVASSDRTKRLRRGTVSRSRSTSRWMIVKKTMIAKRMNAIAAPCPHSWERKEDA